MVGLYVKALRLKSAVLKTPDDSGGPAVVATGSAGETVYTPEVWGQHGEWSIPPDDTMGIMLPVGGGDQWNIVFATHHYAAPRPTLAKGEKAVGATDATGTVLKAHTIYKADGVQELNGNGKRFVTWDELNTALQTFITALNLHTHPTAAPGPPSPPTAPMSLDITTAKTTTIKTGG